MDNLYLYRCICVISLHKMAEHCINFHLKTNERYMSEQEKVHPVSAADEELIRQSFKEEYARPIRDWALIQSDRKRLRLAALIHGEPSTKKLAPEMTTLRNYSFSMTHDPDPGLVVRSGTGVIDFNRSVLGDTLRKVDPRAFRPTLIQSEGIFGFPTPYKTRSWEQQPTYSEFLLKKLFKPNVANKILDRCDEYFDLLQELVKWCDKKGNGYPVDPIKGRKNLKAETEREANKAKNSEDHMYPPGYRKLEVRKGTILNPKIKVRGADLSMMTKKLMTSAYVDSFCDETHKAWLERSPETSPSYKPVDNPTPYAYFPGNPFERDIYEPDEYIYQQARENRISGRMNRDIFNSKTCL